MVVCARCASRDCRCSSSLAIFFCASTIRLAFCCQCQRCSARLRSTRSMSPSISSRCWPRSASTLRPTSTSACDSIAASSRFSKLLIRFVHRPAPLKSPCSTSRSCTRIASRASLEWRWTRCCAAAFSTSSSSEYAASCRSRNCCTTCRADSSYSASDAFHAPENSVTSSACASCTPLRSCVWRDESESYWRASSSARICAMHSRALAASRNCSAFVARCSKSLTTASASLTSIAVLTSGVGSAWPLLGIERSTQASNSVWNLVRSGRPLSSIRESIRRERSASMVAQVSAATTSASCA
mmetsp:Transcript_33263/g.97849  ORF Transcript_33263/g.97849 Transcript_33263/m.97849 type:complete len:299 (+) Transcript_33263:97-993(+)